MWPFCKHDYQPFHPIMYQDHVRKLRCIKCEKFYDEGVRGEHGQIIHYGYSVNTGKALFGAKELERGK